MITELPDENGCIIPEAIYDFMSGSIGKRPFNFIYDSMESLLRPKRRWLNRPSASVWDSV
jgi:hypothetical protein